MKYISIPILVLCLSIIGCDMFKSPKTLIGEKAWAEVKEKLKSPSSAKLVSAEVVEIQDKNICLKLYLQENFLISSLSRNIDLLTIANKSPEINDRNIDKVRTNILRDVGEFDHKGQCAELNRDLHSKKTCKEMSRVLANNLDIVTKQETEAFGKDLVFKVYYVEIKYDAQNSYGAILRGDTIAKVIEPLKGYYYVVND